jgi:uncharacterized 2Fe-2S/4Fe-4S cluster protein (DUF4445 family)
MPTITLQPTNVTLAYTAQASLRDLLFEQGVEFPCGGNGRCRGCKVRVMAGEAPLTQAELARLSAPERAAGWRLACQLVPAGDLTLELRQWDAAILGNDAAFSFSPRPGLGVAVDLGTTTLVAQLLDLTTSQVLAVRTALNPQARHGADVMSRVSYAVQEGGAAELTELIRRQIGKLLRELLFAAQVEAAQVNEVVIVGNTVMHHLFCAIDLAPMAQYPFTPSDDGLHEFLGEALGWDFAPAVRVRFLPCLGGFVGSDILAGILATGMHRADALVGLVDLGTNGEIVFGSHTGMLCASTAAGPAFEGARIGMGMRAAAGAISEVKRNGAGDLTFHVLGQVAPTGICGSGLVDAVACGLEMGTLLPNGRFADGTSEWHLLPPVTLNQTDIRQLQLAKGAITAGIRLLLAQLGAELGDVTTLYLAGAFGNYIKRISARRIGLLPFAPEQVMPVGNSALLGAKLALFLGNNLGSDPHNGDGGNARFDEIRTKIHHVSLHADPQFMDTYVAEMSFPAGETV